MKNIQEFKQSLFNSKNGVFYAYLLSTMQIEVNDSIPYAAINPNKLIINSKLLDMSDDEVFYIITHECLHIYFEHFKRFEKQLKNNPELVNVATDLAINSLLGQTSLTILHPSKFNLPNDLDADDYYILLKSKLDEKQDKNGNDKNGNDKNGNDKKEYNDEKESKNNINELNDNIEKMFGKKGKLIDDINDYKDKDFNELKERIFYGVKALGNDRIYNKISNTQTKKLWQLLLDKWISSIRKYKYLTYRREHRRTGEFSNIIIPYSSKQKILNIGVFVDTSGSIDIETLSYFMSFFEKDNPDVKISIWASFDTEIYLYKSLKDMKNIKGGGGTNFKPIFYYISKNKIKLDGIIIFTDGFGDYPDTYPKIPVCWFTLNKESEQFIKKSVPQSHLVISL